jgi:arabinose-5-phosphate isomerase
MTVEQAREVLSIEIEGIAAVRDRLGEEFEQAVTIIMDCPSRLIITGIGKSGLVGQKISATLNSTGLEFYRDTIFLSASGRGHAW